MVLNVRNILFIICVSFLALSGCGDLESKGTSSVGNTGTNNSSEVQTEDGDIENAILVSNLKFSDTFFEDHEWSYYSFWQGHRVYPLFDVFAIQSRGVYYKLQIIDYYNEKNESGYYKLRLQGDSGEIHELNLDAFGCGMPIGGVVNQCDTKDLFTLLNLKTLEITEMKKEDAYLNSGWDIGFHRRDIILNSQTEGVGDVRTALIYRNENFFDSDGEPNLQKLADALMTDGDLESFKKVGRLVTESQR